MNVYIKKKNDELYHYGVLGMKWGVRRYQNKDGTLTAAGKKRADKDAKKIANAKARENDATAEFERRLKTSTDPLYIEDAFMKTLDAQSKRRNLVDKTIKNMKTHL